MADKKALHITKEAKNGTFVDCNIEGIKNEGRDTLMIGTKIYNFRKKNPKLWIGILISFFTALIVSIVTLFIEYGYFIK